MQTPLMNNKTQTSLVGNSRSLETQTDSHSTHHRNHLPDDPKAEATKVEATTVEAVEAVEAGEAVEAAEEDYPRQQDQACFLHTDELLTQSF
jgi:hypothetical protein